MATYLGMLGAIGVSVGMPVLSCSFMVFDVTH